MASFGITKVTGAYIESVDVEVKVESKVLLTSDGSFGEAMNYDPSYNFSVKGKGSAPASLGISGGPAPQGIGGQVIITSVKNMQSNEDWESFEYSGVVFPSATAGGCN
jgi:hypothetical protein